MKIPNAPTFFFIHRKAGVIPLLNFAKQYTCMSGRLPFIRSQMNSFGDCFFTTEMSREQTLKFLEEHNFDAYCKFLNKKPTVLDIYYDRVNRY